jgi:hypothetical protein
MSLDGRGLDDDLDVPPAGPLNEDDILWGVERAVSHIETRYVERIVLAAPDDATAAALAKEQCRWWGSCGRVGDVEGKPTRVWVRREGREGIVPWLELAQRVRGTYAPPAPQDEQIKLF